LDVKVNGVQTRAFLDTGCTLTAVSKTLAKKLRLRLNEKSSIKVDHVGGTTNSVGAKCAKLTIGELTKTIVIHVFEHLGDELLLGVRDAAMFDLYADLKQRKLTQRIDGRKEAVNLSKETETSTQTRLSTLVDNVTENALFARDKNDIS